MAAITNQIKETSDIRAHVSHIKLLITRIVYTRDKHSFINQEEKNGT